MSKRDVAAMLKVRLTRLEEWAMALALLSNEAYSHQSMATRLASEGVLAPTFAFELAEIDSDLFDVSQKIALHLVKLRAAVAQAETMEANNV